MSNQLGKKFWTFTLVEDTITITNDFGITDLSIELVSGDGTIQGTLICNEIEPTEIELKIGDPVLISTNSLAIISEIVITTNGVINLIGR
jgi:hypothetical protein